MMFWILSVLSLALALNPARMNLSGRVIAIYSFLSFLTCAVFLSGIARDSDIGFWSRYVDSDAGLTSAYGVTAILLFLLTVYMSLADQKIAPDRTTLAPAIQVKPLHAALLSLYALGAAIYIVATVTPETLFAYRDYGELMKLREIYEDSPVGLLVASTFRFVIMATIFACIIALSNRQYGIVALTLIPIILAFLVGIAESSRILSVYCALAAIGLHLIGRRILAICAAAGVVIFAGYVLEARTHSSLGLAYFPEYLWASLSEPRSLWVLVANAFSGLLLTNASVELAVPSAYSEAYKILSYMPTIGGIDNFQEVNRIEQQRISFAYPFNAFAEAWAFGLPYYVLFWAILFVSGYCVNSSRRFGNAPFLLMLGGFVLGLMFASQYPVRNAARYFYLLILMWFALGVIYRGIMRRRTSRSEYVAAPPRDRMPNT